MQLSDHHYWSHYLTHNSANAEAAHYLHMSFLLWESTVFTSTKIFNHCQLMQLLLHDSLSASDKHIFMLNIILWQDYSESQSLHQSCSYDSQVRFES